MSGPSVSIPDIEPWPLIDIYLLTALWTIVSSKKASGLNGIAFVGITTLTIFATVSFCVVRSLFVFHEKLAGIRCILELITKLPVERYTLPPDLVSKVRQEIFQHHKLSLIDDGPHKKSLGKSKSDQQSKLFKITAFKNVPIENKPATKNPKASAVGLDAKAVNNAVAKKSKSLPQKGVKM